MYKTVAKHLWNGSVTFIDKP